MTVALKTVSSLMLQAPCTLTYLGDAEKVRTQLVPTYRIP